MTASEEMDNLPETRGVFRTRRTPKTEFFAKKVSGWKQLSTFAKSSDWIVRFGSKHVSGNCLVSSFCENGFISDAYGRSSWEIIDSPFSQKKLYTTKSLKPYWIFIIHEPLYFGTNLRKLVCVLLWNKRIRQ